jgi:hypothetical protein
MSRLAVLLGSLLILLAACPARDSAQTQAGGAKGADGGQEQAGPAPAADSADGASPAPASVPGSGQADEPSDGKITFERPAEGNYVFIAESPVDTSRPFTVEFRLSPAPDGDAWVALVPASLESKLLEDNARAAIDRTGLPPQEEGSVELTALKRGEYIVRLFPQQEGEIMAIAQTPVFRAENLPDPGTLTFEPPYVTITDRKLEETPVQRTGMPMIAYWELPEALGADAWIGMVPADTVATDAKANMAAAADMQYLDGQRKYRSIFQLWQPGEYVFRIFPSEEENAPMLCESQRFKVVEPEEK